MKDNNKSTHHPTTSPLHVCLDERRIIDLRSVFSNKSYVMRNTRMKKTQHDNLQRALDELGIAYNKNSTVIEALQNAGSREAHFEKLCIDIGFGAGETLLDMAIKNESTLFIGIETYKQGISNLYNKIKKARDENLNVNNIRLIHHDAVEVLSHMLPSNSLDEIHIFFPDPWRKKRHYKRRLLHFHFLQLCHEVLKPGGILWIVSDWKDYALDIKKHMALCNSQGVMFEEDVQLCETLEKQRFESRFETRGLHKQHEIYAFVYRGK